MGLGPVLEPSEAGQSSPFSTGATWTERRGVSREVDREIGGPRWKYRSQKIAGRPGELERFRPRVAEALRIGHGLGVAFRLEFASGLDGGVALSASGPVAGRWFVRVLAPAYDHQHWKLSGTRAAPEAVLLRVGAPLRSWPNPLRSGSEECGWGDSIAQGIAALPPGLTLVWSLAAAVSPRTTISPPIANPTRLGPAGGAILRASSPTSDTEREWRDRWGEQQQALRWAATIALYSGPAVPARSVIDRASELLHSVSGSPGGNGIRLRPASRWWSPRPPAFVLTEPELLGLLPSLDCAVGAEHREPVSIAREVVLGRNDLGITLDLRIDPEEGRHLAVLGETGMGKSTLLTALARQAGTAHGVVLLDPVGDTGRTLLASLGPRARRRAVWVSPAEAPIGLNALARAGGSSDASSGSRHIADLVQALRRVRSGRYDESSYWGPRIEEMVTRALLAAGAIPGGTLADALKLLQAPERYRSPIAGEAGAAWRDLRTRARGRPEELDGARRLLYEIVGNPVLLQLLCERRPRWSAAELLVEGRIVVVTGDAPSIGEGPARQLLSMYLALLWSEILARPRPSKAFVILDEAQWFGHDALSEMLRIGRRFNIHLVVATQALGSLGEGVREAIATNVADFVLFRGSLDDAREFGRIARSVSPEELMSLRRGEAILLRGKGGQFDRLRTPLGFPPANGPECLRDIARSSMARFGARPDAPTDHALHGVLPPVASAPSGSNGIDLAVGALLAQLAGRTEGDPVRVHLGSLLGDGGEGAVRTLGTILGRRGVLAHHGRDEGGAYWEIRPGEVRAALRRPPRPEPAAG